jgi:hypothetical protein
MLALVVSPKLCLAMAHKWTVTVCCAGLLLPHDALTCHSASHDLPEASGSCRWLCCIFGAVSAAHYGPQSSRLLPVQCELCRLHSEQQIEVPCTCHSVTGGSTDHAG